MMLLVPLIAAVLNRVRGGGFVASLLPGHPRLWTAPAMGVLSWAAGATITEALAWGCGYFLWSTLPVNRWDVLGRVEQTKWPTMIEEAIEAVSFNLRLPFAFGPLAVRECLGVMPTLVAVAAIAGPWWLPGLAPLYAAGVVAVTEVAHRMRLPRFRVISEPCVGALWGLLLII